MLIGWSRRRLYRSNITLSSKTRHRDLYLHQRIAKLLQLYSISKLRKIATEKSANKKLDK